MMSELFSVFDSAANMYIEPFFAPTVAFALRGFQEACQKDGHQFHKFPEDYILYHIATFEHKTGVLIPLTPHKVAMALSFLEPQQEE